jgi:flagellar biosynthesis protein FlhF
MNARKFIAASSRDALKLVRVELGEDAVILSNRKVAEGVEIVAVAGAELAHLSETRVSEGSMKPAVHSAKLSTQGANQAAALGAKVLDANNKRENGGVAAEQRGTHRPPPCGESTAKRETRDTTVEQQTLLSEIKTMRNMMQEQMARLSWSDMQQRDPARGELLRDMLNVGFSPLLSRQ